MENIYVIIGEEPVSWIPVEPMTWAILLSLGVSCVGGWMLMMLYLAPEIYQRQQEAVAPNI